MSSESVKAKVLVVDDEDEICHLLKDFLANKGFEVWCADNGRTAVESFSRVAPDAVLMDVRMPVMDGLLALEQLKNMDKEIPVIMFTGYGDVKSAVQAMKLGAYDFLTKPFKKEDILFVLKRAVEKRLLVNEIKALKERLEKKDIFDQMGCSKHIEKLQHEIERVAKTNYSVTIQGETGTGKEIVARAIHKLSARSQGPFIAIDCAAIPESLVESELFGYERGAFTGADRRKDGHFVSAREGTLFLDEVPNLSLNNQKKLLRALQEGKVHPLGAKDAVEVNVRIISASNVPLELKLEQKEFRQDLYYRLNEFTINVPPLRHRKEDIIFLAKRFLQETSYHLQSKLPVLSEEALKLLLEYYYPGNVRELRNIIRQATLLCDGIIRGKDLPINNKKAFSYPVFFDIERDVKAGSSMKAVVKKNIVEIERQVITQALDMCKGNKSKASRMLQVDYKTLFYKARQYGL